MSKLEINPKSSLMLNFSKEALKIYDIVNVSNEWDFSDSFLIDAFYNVLVVLGDYGSKLGKIKYPKFNKIINRVYFYNDKIDSNKVCLAFSGGLDSVYQALYLREQGYDVHLLHVANMNAYTNGQELKVAKEFAEKFNFPLEIVKFHKSGKKVWQENPFKDFLIYSICLDWASLNKCNKISSGDDMRLSIKDSVFETNISDSKELTRAFFDAFHDFQFIPVDSEVKKDKRLAYLDKYNAKDYYNSCVGPGRLNQYLHNKYEKEFDAKIDRWNCCSCRKCCSHIWYDYVFNRKKYPVALLDRAWKKMSVGADANFFANKESFEEKKAALLNY